MDRELEEYIKLCKITGMDKSRAEAIEKVIEENKQFKSKIKEIRDKAECMDYYCLNDVIDDLNKLLGDE